MPIISIIIPVYNTEAYLRKCLESVRNQIFFDFEAIIVNDGSPDNSKKIIDEYKNIDKRFLSIEKTNGGLSSARNAGLLVANGEYVCFLDSDDWIDSNFLSNLISSMTDDVDIVISRYTLEDSVLEKPVYPCQKGWDGRIFSGLDKEKYILYPLLGPASKRDKSVLNYSHMCVWKNLYRKSFIDKNKLEFVSEREIMLEDYDFNIRTYHYSKGIAICDFCDYQHLIVDESLSRKFRPNLLTMMERLYKRTEIFINENDFLLDKNEAHIRLRNFILKSSIDISYNCILNKPNRIKSSIESVRNNDFITRAYLGKTYIDLPFFYIFFIFLMKIKKIDLLIDLLKISRKMNYFYRFYKSVSHKY